MFIFSTLERTKLYEACSDIELTNITHASCLPRSVNRSMREIERTAVRADKGSAQPHHSNRLLLVGFQMLQQRHKPRRNDFNEDTNNSQNVCLSRALTWLPLPRDSRGADPRPDVPLKDGRPLSAIAALAVIVGLPAGLPLMPPPPLPPPPPPPPSLPRITPPPGVVRLPDRTKDACRSAVVCLIIDACCRADEALRSRRSVDADDDDDEGLTGDRKRLEARWWLLLTGTR